MGSEEIKLLSAMERYGLDWELVSSMLPNKTEAECSSHFYKFYVNEPIQKALIIPQNTRSGCRKVAETSGALLTQSLALLPCSTVDHLRGDWEAHYCNSAEEDFIAGEGGGKVIQKLQVGIMNKYRSTLRKRKLLENLYHEYGEVLLETPRPPDPRDTPPQVVELDPPGAFPLQSLLKLAQYTTKTRLEDIR